MTKIMTEAEHAAALARIDELMSAEAGTPEGAELDELSRRVADYEEVHHPIERPEVDPEIRFAITSAVDHLSPPHQLAAMVDAMALTLAANGIIPDTPAFDSFLELVRELLPALTRATAEELEALARECAKGSTVEEWAEEQRDLLDQFVEHVNTDRKNYPDHWPVRAPLGDWDEWFQTYSGEV